MRWKKTLKKTILLLLGNQNNNKNQQRKKPVSETVVAFGINKIKNNQNVIIKDNEFFLYALVLLLMIFSFPTFSVMFSHVAYLWTVINHRGLAPPHRQLNTQAIVIKNCSHCSSCCSACSSFCVCFPPQPFYYLWQVCGSVVFPLLCNTRD